MIEIFYIIISIWIDQYSLTEWSFECIQMQTFLLLKIYKCFSCLMMYQIFLLWLSCQAKTIPWQNNFDVVVDKRLWCFLWNTKHPHSDCNMLSSLTTIEIIRKTLFIKRIVSITGKKNTKPASSDDTLPQTLYRDWERFWY